MRTALQIAHHISEYKQTDDIVFDTDELVKLAKAYIRKAELNVDMRESIWQAIQSFNKDGMGCNEGMKILRKSIRK